MPKKQEVDDVQVAVSPEAIDEVIKNALVELPATAAVPVKAARKLSFEQFAARNPKIKAHHHSGMRAFVKSPDKSRTEEEWNTLFENY